MNYTYSILLPIAVLITSCASQQIRTSVKIPAVIALSPEVKKVAVLDRNTYVVKNQSLDNFDKFRSADGPEIDQQGGDRAVQALRNNLSSGNRFESVILIDEGYEKGNGRDIFPELLSWEVIQEIADKQNLDLLYVLEYYDITSRLAVNANRNGLGGGVNLNAPLESQVPQEFTDIKLGWRMYDPKNKLILDEYEMINTQGVNGGANIVLNNIAKAAVKQNEGLYRTSEYLGSEYGERIKEHYLYASRKLYKKGSANMEYAARLAKTDDWYAAAELWREEIQSFSSKVAERASYNLALHHERLGELDQAIQILQDSYTKYNHKKSLYYMNLLRNRRAQVGSL